MRRHPLKRRDVEKLLGVLQPPLREALSAQLSEDANMEVAKTQQFSVYLVGGVPAIAAPVDGEIFPTLKSGGLLAVLPLIVVDMGAVPKISNGADVMAPGIRRVEGNFQEKALVTIVDERNLKPIAVGSSLAPSTVVASTRHGKVVKNLHHVGDALWRILVSTQWV